MHSKELGLVQEYHTTVKLDLSAAFQGMMKTYSKSRIELPQQYFFLLIFCPIGPLQLESCDHNFPRKFYIMGCDLKNARN